MSLTGSNRGTAGNNSGASSLTITFPQAMAAGSLGAFGISLDNAGSGGSNAVVPTTAIDSVGNTWTRRQSAIHDPGAASAGVELAIYTCDIVVAITTSTTLVLNFGTTVTAKAVSIHEVLSDLSTKRPRYKTGGIGTGAGTGTPTVTTASITNGNMVIGVGGAESASTWTGDGDTTNGSWSSQQAVGFGTGNSGMSVTSQRKVVTATATQTYNPTLTSADCILAWIEIEERDILTMKAPQPQYQQLLAT